MAKQGKGKGGVTIIRREEIVEGGHHGGAWKVAYADFVTAMMAFFLLMWLLNATTAEQRKGLADYFAPTATLSRATTGSGAPLGGRTPFDAGSMVSDRGAQSIKPGMTNAPVAPDDAESDLSNQQIAPRLLDDSGDPSSAQLSHTSDGADGGATGSAAAAASADKSSPTANDPRAAAAARAALAASDARERASMEGAAEQIREAIRADPSLAPLARQLSIDITPEGLRIQLMDEEGQPMFSSGSATLIDRARQVLVKIAPVLAQLSEPIAITGHTDATPFHGGDRTNWELSSDRAHATRRLLVEAGINEDRFRSVTGAADRDPLLPATPQAAANRRIAIVVLRTHGASSAPAIVGAPAKTDASAPAPAAATPTPPVTPQALPQGTLLGITPAAPPDAPASSVPSPSPPKSAVPRAPSR